jgi:hypothetical protein
MVRDKNFFSLIFLLSWLLLWGSINTQPSEIFSFGKNLILSVNSLRFILPSLFFILMSIYLFFIVFTKKIKINKIHLYFFAILFSQSIGLYLNNDRIFFYFSHENYFDMSNINLIIFPFNVICLFILCEYHNLNRLYKNFFVVAFIFLFLMFNLSFWPKINSFNDFNLYDVFNPHDINILQQSSVRITGLSRTLAIINLFIILYFLNLKKNYLKRFLEFLITISTLLLLFMQSRGTLLCYFISVTFIIFIISKDKKDYKIKNILLFIIVPIFLYFIINNHLHKNIKQEENAKSYSRILSPTTSGRTSIWSYTLKNYEYNKIFGYGPNGDRFFLKDFHKKKEFGDNSSNIFIYSILSGGIVSLFFLILIFINIFVILKKFMKSKTKSFYKDSLIENLAIVCLIFFSVRSIFENSFGLFSVDFLIVYLSLLCLISIKKIGNS